MVQRIKCRQTSRLNQLPSESGSVTGEDEGRVAQYLVDTPLSCLSLPQVEKGIHICWREEIGHSF